MPTSGCLDSQRRELDLFQGAVAFLRSEMCDTSEVNGFQNGPSLTHCLWRVTGSGTGQLSNRFRYNTVKKGESYPIPTVSTLEGFQHSGLRLVETFILLSVGGFKANSSLLTLEDSSNG